MNKIYRTIWSEVRHMYVAVSEIAKTHGKKSGGSLGKPARALLAAAVLTAGFFAAPWGDTYVRADYTAGNTAAHNYIARGNGGSIRILSGSLQTVGTSVWIGDNDEVAATSSGAVYTGTTAPSSTSAYFKSGTTSASTSTMTSDGSSHNWYQYVWQSTNNSSSPSEGRWVRDGYSISTRATNSLRNSEVANMGGNTNLYSVAWIAGGDQPEDILTTVRSVNSTIPTTSTDSTPLATNLSEQLQQISASGYGGVSNAGTYVTGSWGYVIYDESWASALSGQSVKGYSRVSGNYVDVGDTGHLPMNFVYAGENGATGNNRNGYYLRFNSSLQQYEYGNDTAGWTAVDNNYIYVINDGEQGQGTNRIGVFVNYAGNEVYTGTVYGGNNTILETTSRNENGTSVLYSYWGSEIADGTATMQNYSLANYNRDLATLVSNDTALAHNDINHVSVRATTNDSSTATATISLYRNGTNMNGDETSTNLVDGQIIVTPGGGSGGIANNGTNDRTLTISDGTQVANHSRTFHLGSQVGVQNDIAGHTLANTSYNLQSLTINGTTYGLKTMYAGDDSSTVTKSLGQTLSITGGASTDSLTTGNIGVVNSGTSTNGALSVRLNKDVNLTSSGSLTVGNTAVNNTGVTVTTSATDSTQNPSITTSGISGGSKQITNVASGGSASGSTNAANISDVHRLAKADVQVANGKNITVSHATVGEVRTDTVSLNDDITLGTTDTTENANKAIRINGTDGTITVGSSSNTDNYINLNGTTGVATVGGITIGNIAGNTTVDGSTDTKNYITGLENTTWNPSVGIVSGRAATEDQLRLAMMHFFSINHDGTDDESTIGNYYNDGATGEHAMAIGHNVKASGAHAIAIGDGGSDTATQTSASGSESLAIGHQTTSSGDRSIAIGNQNAADGLRSVSLGMDVQAGFTDPRSTSVDATVRSHAASVTSDNYEDGSMRGGADVAIGNKVRVYGTGSTAIGFGAKVGVPSTAAVGETETMTGETDLAVAIGGRSLATQTGSVALGNLSYANRKAGRYGYGNTDGNSTDSYADVGTLQPTYDETTGVATNNSSTYQAGTAWVSNAGAVSIGSDERTGTVTNADGTVDHTYTIPKITRQLTGLAAGSEDTDAVNVAQLKAIEAEGLNFTGQNTDSSTSALEIVHTNQGGTLSVQGGANSTENTTGNIYVSADKNSNRLTLSLKDDVNIHTLTAGTAGATSGTTGTVSIVGQNDTAYTAYNITSGRDSSAADLNGNTDRLSYTVDDTKHTLATMTDGLKFAGDDSTHVVRTLMDQEMTIIGGATNTADLVSDGNIGVVANDASNPTGLYIRLNKNITGLNTVQAGSNVTDTYNDGTTTFTSPYVTTGNQTVDVSDSDTSDTNPGTETGNYVTGLTNRKWTVGQTKYVSGRAATEDQLKTVSDQVQTNTTNISNNTDTINGGWNAAVVTKTTDTENPTKTTTINITPKDNKNTLTVNEGDNIVLTPSSESQSIGVATTPIVGFTTVHVGGNGTGNSATGGITLGNQTSTYQHWVTTTDASGNTTTTLQNTTDSNGNAATSTGLYITGLQNTTWDGTNFVSGRAATEDQLRAAIQTSVSAASDMDHYITNGTVNWTTNTEGTQTGAGSLVLTRRDSQNEDGTVNASNVTIDGLHDYYVTNATTSTNGNITTVTLNRNDGGTAASFKLNFPTTDYRVTAGSYSDGTLSLTVQDGTDTTTQSTVEITGLNTLYGADNSSEDNTSHVVTRNLGQRLNIIGNAAEKAKTGQSYNNGNINTAVDDDNNIVISLNDNPTLATLLLQGSTPGGTKPTITLDVNTDGRLTVQNGTTVSPVAYTTDGLTFQGNTGSTTKSLNSTLAVKGTNTTGDTDHRNITVAANDTDGLALTLNDDVHITNLRAGSTAEGAAKAGSVTIVGSNKNGGYQEVKIESLYDSEMSRNPASREDNDGTTRLRYTNGEGTVRTLATLEDGYHLAADSGTSAGVGLNKTITVKGTVSGAAATSLASANNIATSISKDSDGNGTWLLQLSKNLSDLTSVTAGDGTNNAVLGYQTAVHQKTRGSGDITTDTDNGTINSPGTYLTGLTNTSWDGSTYVTGRAATEDQLRQVQNTINQVVGNGKYGLTADDTNSLTSSLNNNIKVKGSTVTLPNGKEVVASRSGQSTTTAARTDTSKQNITTSVSAADEIFYINLASQLALGTDTSSSTDSDAGRIDLYGIRKSETGSGTDNSRIHISAQDGISLRHTSGDTDQDEQLDGIAITGPYDRHNVGVTRTYDVNGNLISRVYNNTDYNTIINTNADGSNTTTTDTERANYADSNGSFAITNNKGQFTARLSDIGATGYLGLGNTVSTLQSNPDIITGEQVQDITTTDSNGTVTRTDQKVARIALYTHYGTASLNDAANVTGSKSGTTVENADGTTTTYSAITGRYAGTGAMTRLKYLDQEGFNDDGTTTGRASHEIATLDDGLVIAADMDAAYDTTDQAAAAGETLGQRNLTLNKKLTFTGGSTNSQWSPANYGNVHVSVGSVYENGADNPATGTNVTLRLAKNLKGFNTIQLGGTEANTISDTSAQTIRIGNLANGETTGSSVTPTAVTASNYSNVRYSVDTTTGTMTDSGNLYEATDDNGNTYYTTNTSDTNLVKQYRDATTGNWTRVEKGGTIPSGRTAYNVAVTSTLSTASQNGTDLSTLALYQVTDGSGNTYYTTDSTTGGTAVTTNTLNPTYGRYMTGLSNTQWDGEHIDADRAATEGQLRSLQQQIISYNETSGGFALSADQASTTGGSTTVTQNLGSAIAVKGDTNITTTADNDAKSITVSLNKDLNVNSVTTGNTVINNSGVTITNGNTTVSLTDGGLNNGGNKITNVAAGTDPTDAVNVSQLTTAVAGASNTVSAGRNIGVSTSTNSNHSTNYTVALNNQVTLGETNSAGSLTVTDGAAADAKTITIGAMNATATIVSDITRDSTTGHLTINSTDETVTNGVDYGGTRGLKLASGNTGKLWDAETTEAWNQVDGNPWVEYNDSFNNAANIGDIYAIAKRVNNETSASPASSGNNTYVHQLGTNGTYQVDLNDSVYLGGNHDAGSAKISIVAEQRNTDGTITSVNPTISIAKADAPSGTSGALAQALSRSAITISQETFTRNTDGSYSRNEGTGVSMGGNQVQQVASGFTGLRYDESQDSRLNNAANIGDLSQVANNVNIEMNRISGSVNRLSNRVNRVGAGAAALAALHPLDFDPDEKWDFAAGYGHYKNANAAAVGAYYRPNEDTMFSIGGSFGGGENMLNAGVSFKLGQGNHVSTSRVAMAKELKALRKEVEDLRSAMADMEAGKRLDPAKTKLFPDIPENHWAYEAISTLYGNGVVEGYPDGNFGGDRMMTRYEFAMMVYRAMQDGKNVSSRLFHEFEPELEYIRVDVVAKDKDGNPTIERVRVNNPPVRPERAAQ